MTLSRRASVLLAALLACVLAMANPTPAEAAPRTWQAAVVLGVWPNYAGAGDVLVEAIPSGQTQPTASALTDANGQVTLTLESGVPYSARFTYLGTGLYTGVPQSTGIYQEQQTLRVPALHTISGTVHLGSESRPAVAGEVEVSALIGGVSYFPPVQTDDTGAYTLRLDPRNDYVVRFDYIGDEPWSDGRTPGVVEIQGASVDGVDAVLQPGSLISGSVRNSAGEPVSGATVRAAAVAALPDGTWLSYTGTTDQAGAFRIDSMGPGDYEVEIAAPGYVTVRWPGVYWYPAPEVLDLTVPTVRTGLDATVLRAATIEGSVVVDGMYAWEYTTGSVFAELQLYQAERAVWTTVHSSAIASGGGYRFSGLLPGEYRVRAGYSGPRGLDTHVSPTLSVGEDEVRTWNSRTLSPSVGLQPGVLVKGSGPDVYLVDGPNQLVRLPSFAVAQDLGIPTSYSVVPDARLEDYEIDHRPLSNLVSCDGGQLAAGGRLYGVGWKEFPYSPRAELESTTCLRLAITGQRFSGYLSGGGQVWYPDEAGTRHVVLGGGGLPAHAVNDWFLGGIPTGAPRVVAGGLVKFDDSPAVYLANGYSRLAKLTSFGTVSDFGLPTSFVTRPASERAGYESTSTRSGTRWTAKAPSSSDPGAERGCSLRTSPSACPLRNWPASRASGFRNARRRSRRRCSSRGPTRPSSSTSSTAPGVRWRAWRRRSGWRPLLLRTSSRCEPSTSSCSSPCPRPSSPGRS